MLKDKHAIEAWELSVPSNCWVELQILEEHWRIIKGIIVDLNVETLKNILEGNKIMVYFLIIKF